MNAQTRYDGWMRRVIEGALDFWGENWRDVSTTAQYAAWRQLAAARGADTDVQYHMTRSLLPEVIYAAGGVERELGLIRTALADVQRFADEGIALFPPTTEEWPTCGWHVSTPSMREASYSFTNLLSWVQSAVDRTERRDRQGNVVEPLGCYRPWPRARSTTLCEQRCRISGTRFQIRGCSRTILFMPAR